MSDFIFLHQQKIVLRFLKLLKPLTFSEVNLNIDITDLSHKYKQNCAASVRHVNKKYPHSRQSKPSKINI